MPVPNQIYRIDPRDLDKNRAIGVALPFNGTAVFRSTYSTRDQIKSNLINLILTNKGERIENPEFGSSIRRMVFEQITEDNIDRIKESIMGSVQIFLPEVAVKDITINPEPDLNKISIQVQYQLKLSGDRDSITIEFE